MADLFNTSVSGLLAMQKALQTTSHNISNVNTDGYSRQKVDFAVREPQPFGNGFVGSGVEVQTIRRMISESREESLRTSTSRFEAQETLAQLTGRLDDLLADQSAGLSPTLNDFFASVQDVSNDPGSATAREAMLSQGENLVSRFNYLDQRLAEVSDDVEERINLNVEEINQLAQSIAQVNESIVAELGRTGGQPPNDLLDQRGELIRQLSERVDARTVAQENGAVNVFIGTGQVLVSGFTANSLAVTPSQRDPNFPEVSITSQSGQVNITSNLTGGRLGGALDFRREVLDPVRDDLGRLAATVSMTFNSQHQLGMQYANGPAGELGGDFFDVASPQVIIGQGNSTPDTPAVSFDAASIGDLTGQNYEMIYDAGAGQWNVRNLTDGTSTAIATGGAAVVDGVQIDTAGMGGLADGDSFLLRPTRDAAGAGLDVAVTRPSQIAAAGPVRAGEQTDASGLPVNTGSGQITQPVVSNTSNMPLASDITLTFDAAGNQFVVNNGPGGTIPYDPATDADGREYTFPGYGGMTFSVSGVPDDGDEFVIERNSDGDGDNRNALLLGGLQDRSILSGGAATYQEAYSSLVGEVGTATQRAQTNRDAQQTGLEQAKASREEVSGVNLEEEAANLLRYQQAYQAAAQSINIARSTFDSLLSAVRG